MSGNTVIAIVVTDTLVEVWSAEPAGRWTNPSLITHGKLTSVQYLGQGHPERVPVESRKASPQRPASAEQDGTGEFGLAQAAG